MSHRKFSVHKPKKWQKSTEGEKIGAKYRKIKLERLKEADDESEKRTVI